VEVVLYVSIRDKEVNVKTVEVVLYVSIRDINIHAKTVNYSISK